ncbi:MAG: response regulator transcription factor [Roseburia sp.]|nr:response regulator transcription factor [Roseburia sp.]
MSNKILIVEDDRSICEMVDNYLISEGFSTDGFRNGRDALRAFQADSSYALVLIDLMLPDMSGMELIKEIRRTGTVPIIIVTARDNDTDKTMGLNLGADDYVVKPFSLIELTARIRANIRRATGYDNPTEPSVIRIRDLEINPSAYTAKLAGVSLELTRTEFEILRLLASHPGQAFSKERLYDLIWREPYLGNENVLNTHINRLRAKLKNASDSDANGDAAYIKTLWGIGYKMEDK